MITSSSGLTSLGLALDLSPQAFGELRATHDPLAPSTNLRARMIEDGYLQRDVDVYCTNRADAPDIESGAKTWQDWDGRLSSDPVRLREKLGGRWLTTGFHAGDVLTFSMAMVHASLDNHSSGFRLSSDSRYQLASEPADERWIGANPIAHGPAGKKGKIC